MLLISDDERQQVSNAISIAEQATSGEIVAVIASASDSYTYVPFLVAALAALLVPWPLIYFTWWPVQSIYIVQLIVFLVLIMALWPKSIRAALVPRSIRETNAERRAAEQFLVQNLHTTSDRTGVLVFLSVLESHAVICADKAIDERVAEGTWKAIIDDLTAGIGEGHAADALTAAIAAIGRHLGEHFPPTLEPSNELPNHLIVLTD